MLISTRNKTNLTNYFLIFSPILEIANYHVEEYFDGKMVTKKLYLDDSKVNFYFLILIFYNVG